MTMLHATFHVAAAAMLPFIALTRLTRLLSPDTQAPLRLLAKRPLIWAGWSIAMIVLAIGLIVISARLIIAIASSSRVFRTKAGIGPTIAILGATPVATVLMLACVHGRMATFRELLVSVVASIGLWLSLVIFGLLVAAMRRPYAEWLTLEVAG